jgi:hypothetical protein
MSGEMILYHERVIKYDDHMTEGVDREREQKEKRM